MNPTIDSIRRQYQALVDLYDKKIAYAKTTNAILPEDVALWKVLRDKAQSFVTAIEKARKAEAA